MTHFLKADSQNCHFGARPRVFEIFFPKRIDEKMIRKCLWKIRAERRRIMTNAPFSDFLIFFKYLEGLPQSVKSYWESFQSFFFCIKWQNLRFFFADFSTRVFVFELRFAQQFWVKLNWTTNNNKFSDNPDWALSQVLYGALFGLAILFIAVWTDFGFVLDFIFGLPSFFSKKKLISFTKDRPSQQLDLSEIEGDISLGNIFEHSFYFFITLKILDTQNAITSEHANHQISSTEFDRNQSPESSTPSIDSWPTPPEALCPVKQDTSFAKISRISRSINNYIPKGDAFFRASGMPVGGGRFNSVERKSFLTDNPTTRRSAFKVSW